MTFFDLEFKPHQTQKTLDRHVKQLDFDWWAEGYSNLRLLCVREVSHDSIAPNESIMSTALAPNTSKCRATRTIIGGKHLLILSINLFDSYDTELLGFQHLKQRV